MTIEQVVNILFKYVKMQMKIPTITIPREYYNLEKGTVDNMNTPKFILHTNSKIIIDGAEIEYAKDIIDLIDYFELTNEKYHFDILTIDGYIDCFKLFIEYIGTKYEETIESMLSEYQRYLRSDCNE